MKMNPKVLLQMRDRIDLFNQQHPRFGAFLNSIYAGGVREGMIVELRVTDTDGQSTVTNIRLTAEDVETMHMAESLKD